MELVIRWVVYGFGDIIDNIKVFSILVESLYDVDFIVVIIARSRAKYYYYVTLVELVSLLEEKFLWMSYVALVFGREDFGLINEELALVDVFIGVSMVADYFSFNLG